MAYFDVDISTLVRHLLPVRLRKSITLAWLNCLVQPVRELYALFLANRAGNLYVLGHNGQTVYLEAALNDTFDPIARGIFISDGANADPLFVYLDAEAQPLWLGLVSEEGTTSYPDPQWLYTDPETSVNGYQFIVMVPAGLVYDPARMTAMIDKYRLPSKNIYTIETY
jgi:hypothetical protein